MVVTRWNPSTNGALHLGHIYTLLVNEYFAKSRGGKFYIRFDDTSPHIKVMNQHHVTEILGQQINDIRWLGIEHDGFYYQSAIVDEVQQTLKDLGHVPLQEQKFDHYLPLFIREGLSSCFVPYPYVPEQIVERVVMDHAIGVTHVIRGEDFATEYCLYMYYCQKLGFPYPEFVFLPRLSGVYGDISKTKGGYTITELRGEGYTPEEVKRLLEKACLYYANNGWELYNIRANPRVDL